MRAGCWPGLGGDGRGTAGWLRGTGDEASRGRGAVPPVVVSVVAEYIKAGTAIANGICAPHAGDGRARTRLN